MSTTIDRMLTRGRPPWFGKHGSTQPTCELGYDVLHEAKVTAAADAAMVTTYRCSDDSWTMATYFGDEAKEWFAGQANTRDLVERVRPV
ncbi:MAG: hypothetical protein WCG47_32860 [Dermatophilaceae bacterium]